MGIKNMVKQYVHQRDHYKCRKCDKGGKTQFHHIVPQRLNGSDDGHNLISLCCDCHTKWHQIEAALGIGFMKKRIVDIFYKWLRGSLNKKVFHKVNRRARQMTVHKRK